MTARAMSRATAAALAQINRRFYRRYARSFSATRESPWPAWTRVAEIVEARADDGPIAVLDLGCGNGRLGRFLESRWSERLDYLGVDESAPILEIAREMGGAGRFARSDLLRDELPGGRFDLICAFGLLHHLPGFARRVALLRAAARRLAPGGLLALSFWQFGDRRRFRRRIVPWRQYNRSAPEPIDTGDLEEGDVLLAWGPDTVRGAGPPVRYCHWTTAAEAERLLADLPLESLASFRADGDAGDLNLYRLLTRSGAVESGRRSGVGLRP